MLETGKEGDQVQAAHLPSPDSSHVPTHNLSHLPGPEIVSIPMNEDVSQDEQRQPKRRRVTGAADLSVIGSNMERHGRGIFKPPYPRERASSPFSPSSNLPALPPKEITEVLMRQYQATLHPTLPVIHWPSFQSKYDAVYKANSLKDVPRMWVALLFAVFACGTLHRSWHDGKKYLEISRSLIDTWTEDLTLDHARIALLQCIFLVEMNHKSAGWIWIGFAVRISFDIGLHCETGRWSPVEEENRRRVWWSIYTCDW